MQELGQMGEMTRPEGGASMAHHSGDTGGVDADLMDELASCWTQLCTFCCDPESLLGDHNETDDGDDRHSAAEIASECLTLLESLSKGDGDTDDADDEREEEEEEEGEEGEKEKEKEKEESRVVSAEDATAVSTSESLLLQNMSELGDELQSLMAILCPPPAETDEADASTDDTACIAEQAVHSPCPSPKMVALTQRLAERLTTRTILTHTAHHRYKPFPMRIQSVSKAVTVAVKQPAPPRPLLSDAAFWRQHQSQSLQRHLQRQSKAHTIQQKQQDQRDKVAAYRYRRVAKPSYPLATNKNQSLDAIQPASPVETIPLPEIKPRSKRPSYTARFSTRKNASSTASDAQPATNTSVPREDDDGGLLCGVYLFGKRRSRGMLYLTCASLEQLKTQIAAKFALPQPVVNVYREQIGARAKASSKRERKVLHRVTRFHELRDGDLLCATTDGYDDMAILCAWMKTRQQASRKNTGSQKPTAIQETASTLPRPRSPDNAANNEPRGGSPRGLTYQPPPPPAPVKVWDENGRLVHIPHRLPLAD